MTEYQRGPSEVEELQADYPEVNIWRDFLEDGGHSDWIAELRLTLRSSDVETLRLQLERAHGLGTVARPWANEGTVSRG